MTALGLGGLGRRPITVSVFPDFHPAQVAWGVGTILRRCPTRGSAIAFPSKWVQMVPV